jgi:hypothetical protein
MEVFKSFLLFEYLRLLICFSKIFVKYRFFFILKILEFHVKVFKINNKKFIILLADIYSQKREVIKEQKILKKFYLLNLITNDSDIARLGYCSVIIKDFKLLKKLLIFSKNNLILNLYLKGLYNSKDPATIDFISFAKIEHYFNKSLCKYENFIKESLNFYGYDNRFNSQKNFFCIKKKRESKEVVKDSFVLISCDFNFFKIFADHYISNFRLLNSHIIHFHIISNEIKFKIYKFFENLEHKYKNLRISIEKEKKKNKIYTTLARFILCRKLMQYYNRNVFINDIDFTPNYNLSNIDEKFSKTKYNIGLMDQDLRVPWVRFAAGICYFKNNNEFCENFLKKLSAFYAYKMRDLKNTFWSVDQAGLALVFYSMKKKAKVLNFFKHKQLFDIKKNLTIPRHLALKKIKEKFSSKNFDQ